MRPGTLLFLICVLNPLQQSLALYGAREDAMRCSYGERGSLTATCVNATPNYFKSTTYRFDHLDETLQCVNCTLKTLDSGTFDISGNQLKHLVLSNAQIENVKTRAFVGLVFLETLNMQNNSIRSIYPGTFTGVKKITSVNLVGNQINMLPEKGFSELVNLRKLFLNDNKIETIDKFAFEGLTNLEELHLENNAINSFNNVFHNMSSLTYLDLSNNKISVLSGHEFDYITTPSTLNLAHNQIKTIPDFQFTNMSFLWYLDLSYNSLEKVGLNTFKGLDGIVSLDLSFNKLTTIPKWTLQGRHDLENLNISHNSLTKFQTGIYAGLPSLSMLNVSNNAINDVEITGVFPLHNLHTLDLSNNNLTDLNYLALLHRVPKIAYLDLHGNFWPCDLETEMNLYFNGDNFKYFLYEAKAGVKKCNDAVKHVRPISDKLSSEYDIGPSYAANVWIFILISLIIVAIGALFVLQYRLYRDIQYNPALNRSNRSISQSQLVSSDLEARDNELN